MSVEGLREGDEASWQELYEEKQGEVRKRAFRYSVPVADLDDIVQESMVTLWLHRSQIDERGAGGYLATIARTKALDHYRRRSIRPHSDAFDDVAGEVVSGQDVAEEAIAHIEADQALHTICELPQPQQTIIGARAQGITQREVSEATGIPLGTIKTATKRVLTRMEVSME